MKKVTLGEALTALESGGRPKGGVSGIADGVPSLGGEHLNAEGGFDFSETRFVPREFYDSLRRGKIQRDDVLVVKDGATTGKVSFVGKEFPFPEAAVNEHVFILRGDAKRVLPKFMFYALFRDEGQRQIRRSSHGAAQGGISQGFASEFVFPLPPLAEQEQIVGLLDEADALRQRRAQADRRTAALLPALFHQMFGDPATNPKHWPKAKLGELCELVNGAPFKPSDWDGEGLPIVRIQNLNDPTKPFNYTSKKLAEKFRVRAGDILLSWSGTPGTSFGCFRWNGPEGWLNQHIFNVKLKKGFDGEFFIQSVNARLSELIARAHGGVGLQHVTKGILNEVEMLIPPLTLQREFAARVTEVRELETAQTQSRARLAALFASLLDKAFKGAL
jgi:type I restriction enzyme S subunit